MESSPTSIIRKMKIKAKLNITLQYMKCLIKNQANGVDKNAEKRAPFSVRNHIGITMKNSMEVPENMKNNPTK